MTGAGQTHWSWDSASWSILETNAPYWASPNPPPRNGTTTGEVIVTQNVAIPGQYNGFNIYGCVYRYDSQSRKLALYKSFTPDGYGCQTSFTARFDTGRRLVEMPVAANRTNPPSPRPITGCFGYTKYRCESDEWVKVSSDCEGESPDTAACCVSIGPAGACTEDYEGITVSVPCQPSLVPDGCASRVTGCAYMWDETTDTYQLTASFCAPGCFCPARSIQGGGPFAPEFVYTPCICADQLILASTNPGGSTSGESGGPGGGSPTDP